MRGSAPGAFGWEVLGPVLVGLGVIGCGWGLGWCGGGFGSFLAQDDMVAGGGFGLFWAFWFGLERHVLNWREVEELGG
ncbi:MAG: hypothetical protein P8J87_20010 [Verrucomicrobiales bacterium]|nr:hypothetical protein [Verrucomicrobiales bacterium]